MYPEDLQEMRKQGEGGGISGHRGRRRRGRGGDERAQVESMGLRRVVKYTVVGEAGTQTDTGKSQGSKV